MPRGRRNSAYSKATDSAAKKGKRGRGQRAAKAAGLRDLVARSVNDLVAAINHHFRGNMAAQVRAFIAADGGSAGRVGKRGRKAGAGRKRILPCIAPGCGNTSKGPRFHYLCEKHMNAPRKDYEAWRLRAREARV